MKGGIKLITSDKIFMNDNIAKKLFKNEKYGKKLSARVISDVIGADYEDVLNNIEPASDEIAFSALTVNSTADVIYHDDSVYFNIEINRYNTKSKPKQLESYVFQLFLSQLHNYKNYNNIKRIVQISIDAYDFFGQGEFMYKVSLMEEKHHIPYNDLISLIHLNVDYLRNKSYNQIVEENNKLMLDLYFLICNDDDILDEIYERDDLMKKIVNEAKQIAGLEKMDLYLTDEEMIKQDEEFIRQEGYKDGLAEGHASGLAEGRNERQNEMIINLYKNGISLDLISKSANLSIEEVQKIINKK